MANRTPNVELGITVLAQIEIGEQYRGEVATIADRGGRQSSWNQDVWATLRSPATFQEADYIDQEINGRYLEGYAVPLDTLTGLPDGDEACGTAFCAAGWANVSAGVPLVYTDSGSADYTKFGDSVSDSALELLGWDSADVQIPGRLDEEGDPNEYFNIFGSDNSVDDLYVGFADKMHIDEPTLRERVAVKRVFILEQREIRRQEYLARKAAAVQ